MAATKLTLYNGALLILGERGLTSLTEAREPRRVLDRVWSRDPIKYCLERGQWKFAMNKGRLTYNPSFTPPSGFRYQFTKPDDFVRICAISSEEYFHEPLTQYEDLGHYWFADYTEIFIKYVSDHETFGRDYSLWPKNFEKYVEAFMAFEASDKLTSDKGKLAKARGTMDAALTEALSTDAMAGPAKKLPTGSWVGSRTGSSSRER